MDERAILSLVTQAVRHIIREHGGDWDEKDQKEVAECIADAAWNGLILGMREILSGGQPVILDELGRFELVDGRLLFYPDDSLLEAGALSLHPDEGNRFLASHAVFYLSQATALIMRIPQDVVMPEEISEEEKLLRGIFHEVQGLPYRQVLRRKLAALFDAVAELKQALMRGQAEKREPAQNPHYSEPAAALEAANRLAARTTALPQGSALLNILDRPARAASIKQFETENEAGALQREVHLLREQIDEVKAMVRESLDRTQRESIRQAVKEQVDRVKDVVATAAEAAAGAARKEASVVVEEVAVGRTPRTDARYDEKVR